MEQPPVGFLDSSSAIIRKRFLIKINDEVNGLPWWDQLLKKAKILSDISSWFSLEIMSWAP